VHPIEHLRYVARATGADATLLTQEAASALSVFARDPHALLTGAKSLLAKQAAVGPVWWMCSRMLIDSDPRDAARRVVQDLQDDLTPEAVGDALAEGATVVISGWPDLTLHALVDRPDLHVLVIDVEGQGHSAVRRLDRHDVDAEAVDPAHTAGAVAEADVAIVEVGALGETAGLTDVGGFSLAAVAKASATPSWLVAGVGRVVPEPYWQEIVQRVAEPDLPAWCEPFEIVSRSMFTRTFGPGLDCPVLPELLRPVR
jgi:hypothetical protein